MTEESRENCVDGKKTTTEKTKTNDCFEEKGIFVFSATKRNWLFYTAFAMVVIFLIFPTFFIFLGVMWPCTFPGYKAVVQLKDNINTLMAAVSLIVGMYSIYYASYSNKNMEMRTQEQVEFLNKLKSETDHIFASVNQLNESNQDFLRLFQQRTNLSGTPLENRAKANEG